MTHANHLSVSHQRPWVLVCMASDVHAGMQSTGPEAGRPGGDLRHHCYQKHRVSMLGPVEGGICLRGALL